jgi:hypothetical protein
VQLSSAGEWRLEIDRGRGSMLNPTTALAAIAEFSIGLAGFTGIVAVFADKRESFRPSEQFRVSNLLLISFTPGFISLFVMALVHAGIGMPVSVRAGSGVLAAFIFVLVTKALLSYLRMTEEERRQLSAVVWWVTMILGSINFVAQMANLVIGPLFDSGILLLGLSATLLISAMTFFVLVMQFLTGRA